MAEIQTEHCVEIRVALIKEEGVLGFGSGYTLEPHWVLTAHHVLFPVGVDESQPIKITWWDESETKIKGEIAVHRDEITWFNEENDIALIRCNPPYEDVPSAWVLIGKSLPNQWVACKCAGFLSNLQNEEENQRRKTPAGNFGGFSKNAIKADVNGLDVELDDDELWEGFSGSPVFSGGKLVAVVRAVNTGQRGAGLVASFVSAALDKEGGRDQVRLRDIPGFLVPRDTGLCWKRLQPGVLKAFETAPAVYEAIKKDYLEKLEKDTDIKKASDLVNALYRAPQDKVIGCFVRVLQLMIQQNLPDEVGILDYLARVWLALLAADQGSIDGLGDFKNDPSAEPFSVSAVDPVPADIEGQAANSDSRYPRLQLYGQRLRSPMDLTPDHKTGLDENDSLAAKDAAGALIMKTRPGMGAFTEKDAKDELEKFATRPETGLSGPIAPEDDKKRGRIIADQLAWDYEEYGGSFYIRIPRPAETGEHSALRDLHQWCPQLVIFEVSIGDNPERMRCLTGLHRIIHKAQSFLADDINVQDSLS